MLLLELLVLARYALEARSHSNFALVCSCLARQTFFTLVPHPWHVPAGMALEAFRPPLVRLALSRCTRQTKTKTKKEGRQKRNKGETKEKTRDA
jgi:hypothetical protein